MNSKEAGSIRKQLEYLRALQCFSDYLGEQPGNLPAYQSDGLMAYEDPATGGLFQLHMALTEETVTTHTRCAGAPGNRRFGAPPPSQGCSCMSSRAASADRPGERIHQAFQLRQQFRLLLAQGLATTPRPADPETPVAQPRGAGLQPKRLGCKPLKGAKDRRIAELEAEKAKRCDAVIPRHLACVAVGLPRATL